MGKPKVMGMREGIPKVKDKAAFLCFAGSSIECTLDAVSISKNIGLES